MTRDESLDQIAESLKSIDTSFADLLALLSGNASGENVQVEIRGIVGTYDDTMEGQGL